MINFSGIEEITPLIVSADGIQVQYPRLSKLRLAQTCLLNPTQRPSFPDVVVPFPALKSLTLGDSFFGDDTPFRGNAAKLEFLDLAISPLTVEILKQHRIFTPTSHPKLVCVKVVRNESLAQDIFRTEVEFMRYILSIGPGASVRVVPNQLQASKLPTIIPMFGDCACIQVLELPHTPLNLWDVLALVKALPLLCDLLTSLPNVRSRPSGVSEKQLFAYVCNNYAPVGVKLRRWRINGGHGADIENAVKCVLLLALACPNFDYAAVDPDLRDLFMAHIKLAITKDGFRKRAPRLRRLLFGGWSNEFFSVHVAQTNATMTGSEQSEYEDEW
ncbi:hypothetical protein FBU31_004634 [Coemansia sp. 'formosensis']|nr:hypothetical protein FBU31_004634 [Coemansia sp. 'formosensis']